MADGLLSCRSGQVRKPTKLKANKFFPRIVVKALNSKAAIIHSTRAPMFEPKKKSKRVKLWPAARFLDIRTLLVGTSQQVVFVKNGMRGIRHPRKTGPQAKRTRGPRRNRILHDRMSEPQQTC